MFWDLNGVIWALFLYELLLEIEQKGWILQGQYQQQDKQQPR